MPENNYTLCANGLLRPGDLVLSTPDDEYACLVGTVLEINLLGTPEHDPGNTTDNIHVNFMDADYSDQRVAEIEAMFSEIFHEKRTLWECPIDDTITPPDALIRITGIEPEKLETILESYDNAAAFCKSALRVQELCDRLAQNMNDCSDSMMALEKDEILSEAGTFMAMSDAYYYLTETHEFEGSEVDYLLKFQNPLKVVADKWYERISQMDDFPFALDAVFDKKDALQGGYELYAEPIPPEAPPGKSVDLKQAAQYEAERLLYELKSLKRPNHPDNLEYMVKVSPEFIGRAGSMYDKLLFGAFQPRLPMTFSGGKDGNIYLRMSGSVRAEIRVAKPSVMERLREGAEKAARQTTIPRTERGRSDPSR